MSANAPDPGRTAFNSLGRTLVLSVVVPLILIQVLLHLGLAPLLVLAIATLPPLYELVLELRHTKRVGFISLVSLVGIVAGFGLAYITGNAVFAVLKDSAFTFIFGCLFLGSLFTERPLIYRLNLDMSGGTPAGRAAATALWEKPHVRRAFRIMTAVWGLGLITDALVRVLIGLTLPIATVASLSPAITVVAFGGLIGWNMFYVRLLRRRAAAQVQA